MYNIKLGTFIYKHSNGFDDLFVKQSDIHGFNTRQKNRL